MNRKKGLVLLSIFLLSNIAFSQETDSGMMGLNEIIKRIDKINNNVEGLRKENSERISASNQDLRELILKENNRIAVSVVLTFFLFFFLTNVVKMCWTYWKGRKYGKLEKKYALFDEKIIDLENKAKGIQGRLLILDKREIQLLNSLRRVEQVLEKLQNIKVIEIEVPKKSFFSRLLRRKKE